MGFGRRPDGGMVIRGSYRLGLFALLVAIGGLLVPGGSAGADGNNTCKFDMFPTAPGGSSELAAGCFLTSAIGAAGNKYVIEDYPQAVWHSGAGRLITTTAATTSGKNITSSTGHFTVADVNNQVTGTNIASNSFIVSVAGSVATLNNAVTGPSHSARACASRQRCPHAGGRHVLWFDNDVGHRPLLQADDQRLWHEERRRQDGVGYSSRALHHDRERY